MEAGVTAQAARVPSAFHPQVPNAFLTIELDQISNYLQSSQRTQIVLPENQNPPNCGNKISMIDIQALNADPFKRDQFSIEVLALVGQVGPSPIHVQENPSVPTARRSTSPPDPHLSQSSARMASGIQPSC